MKKVFLIFGLIAAMALAALATSAAKPANFAGEWSLDKAKSQGLSQRMQNAESVQWTITQDDKQITIESKMAAGAPPAGASAAPGGGMGGGQGRGGGMGGPQTYTLDGKEATAEVGGGQMTGKAVSKATWAKDGAILELSRVSTFQGPNGEVVNTTTQKLELSGDGKVLTVTLHNESPRGTQDSTLVFTKQ